MDDVSRERSGAGSRLNGCVCRKVRRCYDGLRTSGTRDLMRYRLRNFEVVKPCEIIMNCDALAERLMHWAAQDAVQMRLPTEHKREAVQGIVPAVHQHLYVIEDARGKILRFIDRWEQHLAFFPVKAVYLRSCIALNMPGLLPRSSTPGTAQGLPVELHHADG